MNTYAKVLVVAAAIVGIAVIGISLWLGGDGGGVGGPAL